LAPFTQGHLKRFKMKFLTLAATVFLTFNSAVASPLAARAAAAGKPIRRTALNHNLTDPWTAGVDAQASSNWGGAVIVSTGVTEVTGTFTIPKPSPPSGGSSSTEYCGAAWVGIDGDTCQTGLIQTGVFWCVQNGEYSYEAWYEYIPAASIAYSSISVTSGNVIKVTVTKTSDTGGVTTFENVSTGKAASHTFTKQSSGTLCGENAEWIVEDFEEGSSLVPFANFGTVTFTGASAIVGGSTVTPGGDDAQTIYIEQNSKVLTTTTISGGTVTIKYD
jgi:hypothetical protein